PPTWALPLARVRSLVASGRFAEAAGVIAEVRAAAPKVKGRATLANGRQLAFDDVWDSHDPTGPTLEIFQSGGPVFSVPFAALLSVKFLPPQTSYDHLWKPCEFSVRGGGGGRAAVPSMYA